MFRYITIILSFLLISCNLKKEIDNAVEEINGESFQLFKSKNQKAILILFPGFGGGGAENTKNEFKILKKASENNVSVLLMDFDHHVFLKEIEKNSLKKKLESIFEENQLNSKNVCIGGFSAGGNVSLILSNYLYESKSKIVPKEVFIVDSPIDLLKIYQVSEKNIRLNSNEETIEESKWIIENFNKDFGDPKAGIRNYELNSPFTFKTLDVHNVSALKNIKIRFYTEPDIEWWKEHNGNEYEDLNAFSISKIAEVMKKQNFANVEVIKTKNKGFRANGNRHPHSWSIVDVDNLINWMLNK